MSTLTIANATLAEWQAARTAVSFGTSYSIGGRTLTRADLPDIAIEISRASRLVKRFTTAANGSKMPGVSLPKFS